MLVVSPDNRSRMEIDEHTHTELQGRRFCQWRGVPDPDAGTASVLSGADRTGQSDTKWATCSAIRAHRRKQALARASTRT